MGLIFTEITDVYKYFVPNGTKIFLTILKIFITFKGVEI